MIFQNSAWSITASIIKTITMKFLRVIMLLCLPLHAPAQSVTDSLHSGFYFDFRYGIPTYVQIKSEIGDNPVQQSFSIAYIPGYTFRTNKNFYVNLGLGLTTFTAKGSATDNSQVATSGMSFSEYVTTYLRYIPVEFGISAPFGIKNFIVKPDMTISLGLAASPEFKDEIDGSVFNRASGGIVASANGGLNVGYYFHHFSFWLGYSYTKIK